MFAWNDADSGSPTTEQNRENVFQLIILARINFSVFAAAAAAAIFSLHSHGRSFVRSVVGSCYSIIFFRQHSHVEYALHCEKRCVMCSVLAIIFLIE